MPKIDEGPELFIGLAAAVGTGLDRAISKIVQALQRVSYRSHEIHLARLLQTLPGYRERLIAEPADQYISTHMTQGDELRKATGRNDAMAVLAIGEIKKIRQENGATDGKPLQRHAYIFRSLKTPQEAARLRDIYGASFYLIAAYTPRDRRRDNLAQRIARSHNETQVIRFFSQAEALIQRDLEEEADLPYGQNLRDTYHRADVFVDTENDETLERSVSRFVELIFSNTFHTPTRDEYAMFHAKAAALRSAELSRQVGASIARSNGDIVAVGTNEVPRAGGGLYWCGDIPDKREFERGSDSNDEHKRNLIGDTLKRLKAAGWLSFEQSKKDEAQLVNDVLAGDKPVLSSQSLIRNIIEYGRAVHAEMAAIVDAARRGVNVSECTMYVMTFPCHLCARHIVASGIRKVIYIEPYPKSLAADLYPDSIRVEGGSESSLQVLFEPFVGVAPTQYMQLFEAGVRKDKNGKAIPFDPLNADMRYSASEILYMEREDWEINQLSNILVRQGSLWRESDVRT